MGGRQPLTLTQSLQALPVENDIVVEVVNEDNQLVSYGILSKKWKGKSMGKVVFAAVGVRSRVRHTTKRSGDAVVDRFVLLLNLEHDSVRAESLDQCRNCDIFQENLINVGALMEIPFLFFEKNFQVVHPLKGLDLRWKKLLIDYGAVKGKHAKAFMSIVNRLEVEHKSEWCLVKLRQEFHEHANYYSQEALHFAELHLGIADVENWPEFAGLLLLLIVVRFVS